MKEKLQEFQSELKNIQGWFDEPQPFKDLALREFGLVDIRGLCRFWGRVLGHVFHQIATNLIDGCGWFVIDGSGWNLMTQGTCLPRLPGPCRPWRASSRSATARSNLRHGMTKRSRHITASSRLSKLQTDQSSAKRNGKSIVWLPNAT